MTDLDDLKHHIRTEWSKLDHTVIAAAVDQWHHRLSVSVRVSDGHFEHRFWFWNCVCSDNCDLSCCHWPVEQLHANRPVLFNCSCVGSCDLVLCNTWRLSNLQGKVETLIRWGGFSCVNRSSCYYLQKNYNCMFEFVRVMSKVLLVHFSPDTV